MREHTVTKATFEDGREAQFQEMMQQLTLLQSRYKGVRGELLAKVSEELAKLKPGASSVPAIVVKPIAAAPAPRESPPLIRVTPALKATSVRVASTTAEKMLPSCRMCGRGMRLNDADGSLVCEKGHTRASARAAQPEAVSATH